MPLKQLFKLALMNVVLMTGCMPDESTTPASRRLTATRRLIDATRIADASPEQVAGLLKGGADANGRDHRRSRSFSSATNHTPLMLVAQRNANPAVAALLVQAGADVNATSCSKTPLMLAAANNPNAGVLRVLLEAGADLEAMDERGLTSLMLAAAANPDLEVTSSILQAGANVFVKDNKGATALHYAAGHNPNADVTGMLIQAGADVHAKNNNGSTPLMLAYAADVRPRHIALLLKAGAQYSGTLIFPLASNGSLGEVAMALRHGCDVNARDGQGRTPLSMAAASNTDSEVCKLLIRDGATVDSRLEGGATALMNAAKGNANPDVCAVLIAAGADIHARNSAGATPLIVALRQGAPVDVIQLLIDAGSDVNQELDSMTPLEIAARSNARRDLADVLLRAGARVSSDMLCVAVQGGDPQWVSMLAKACAFIDETGQDGMTPLILAAAYNADPNVVSALLSAGAKVNACGDRGDLTFASVLLAAAEITDGLAELSGRPAHEIVGLDPFAYGLLRGIAEQAADDRAEPKVYFHTALIAAAKSNCNPEVVAALLNAGADASIKDPDDRIALDYARQNSAIKGTNVYWVLNNASYVK